MFLVRGKCREKGQICKALLSSVLYLQEMCILDSVAWLLLDWYLILDNILKWSKFDLKRLVYAFMLLRHNQACAIFRPKSLIDYFSLVLRLKSDLR